MKRSLLVIRQQTGGARLHLLLLVFYFAQTSSSAQNFSLVYGDTTYMVFYENGCEGDGFFLKDSIIKNGVAIIYPDSNFTNETQKISFKNYQLDGIRQRWQGNNLYLEEHYTEGKLNGVTRNWATDEQQRYYLYQETEYANNKEIGMKTFYPDSSLLSLTIYTSDSVIQKSFYPNGRLSSVSIRTDTIQTHKEIYNTGEIHFEEKWINGRIADGEHLKYFADGSIEERSYYKKNKPDSIWTTYYDNGNPANKTKYAENNRNDWRKQYYRNGLLRSEVYNYPDGTIKECYYHPNGKDETHLFFKPFRMKHGTFVSYDSLGIKRSEQTFIDGKKNGVWKSWFSNGQLNEVKTYSNDELNGEYLKYKGYNDAYEKKLYVNGRVVIAEEFSQGKKTSYKEYSNGEPTGTWYYYNFNGGYTKTVYEDRSVKSMGEYDKYGQLIREYDVKKIFNSQ